MSSKLLCDKTKALWGLKPEMSGTEGCVCMCDVCVCVFDAISDPSSHHASLRLLSVVPSFVSERGCDPV